MTIAAELEKVRGQLAQVEAMLAEERHIAKQRKKMARPDHDQERGLTVLLDWLNRERVADLLDLAGGQSTKEEVRDVIKALAWMERAAKAPVTRRCRVCGCSELCACTVMMDGCWWVAADLCSGCVPRPGVERLKLKKAKRRA